MTTILNKEHRFTGFPLLADMDQFALNLESECVWCVLACVRASHSIRVCTHACVCLCISMSVCMPYTHMPIWPNKGRVNGPWSSPVQTVVGQVLVPGWASPHAPLLQASQHTDCCAQSSASPPEPACFCTHSYNKCHNLNISWMHRTNHKGREGRRGKMILKVKWKCNLRLIKRVLHGHDPMHTKMITCLHDIHRCWMAVFHPLLLFCGWVFYAVNEKENISINTHKINIWPIPFSLIHSISQGFKCTVTKQMQN